MNPNGTQTITPAADRRTPPKGGSGTAPPKADRIEATFRILDVLVDAPRDVDAGALGDQICGELVATLARHEQAREAGLSPEESPHESPAPPSCFKGTPAGEREAVGRAREVPGVKSNTSRVGPGTSAQEFVGRGRPSAGPLPAGISGTTPFVLQMTGVQIVVNQLVEDFGGVHRRLRDVPSIMSDPRGLPVLRASFVAGQALCDLMLAVGKALDESPAGPAAPEDADPGF